MNTQLEPPCGDDCFEDYTGTVRWPVTPGQDLPNGRGASVFACSKPAHREQAAAYVRQETGHTGVFVPRGQGRPPLRATA